VGAGDSEVRRRAAAAWETWWRAQAKNIEWKQVEVGQLGGALVAELETEMVWEAGPGGKTRWEVDDLRGPYDVRALAGTFNDMATRIEELVGAQQRFVADASHQLRTPLTALRLRLENLRLGADGTTIVGLDAATDEVLRLSRLVDGLLGTGLARPVEGLLARAIASMNRSGRAILALDLPSGLDADTGQPLGVAVRATLTATFVAPKLGFGREGAGAGRGNREEQAKPVEWVRWGEELERLSTETAALRERLDASHVGA